MAKTHLLQAVCTVALLAAAPAFAQTNTQMGTTGAGMGTTGAGGAPNSAMSHDMGPADSSGSGSHAAMMGKHHASMMHDSGAMHARNSDRSQDAAVDQLNDRSYQAAHQGQAFNGSGTSGSMMEQPNGAMGGQMGSQMGGPGGHSGNMNDMSGGSMSGGHGATTGSGGKL